MDVNKLFDKTAYALLYLTVAMLGMAIVIGLVVFFLKREKLADFKKYALGIAVGFSVCALTLMAYLKFETIKADGTDMKTYGMLFYPILAELIIAVVGGASVLVCSLFGKKASKIATLVTTLGLLGGFIAIMVEMSKYFKLVEGDYPNANLVGLIVSAVVIMVLIAVAYFLGNKADISDTRSIVYGAVAIAMSFALSYIKIYEMPQGGSVTFASLLPLLLYCYMFGTRRGIIACLIYGTLQAIQDPFIIHPMQFLLDYPLAFGLIGVSGIFAEKGLFKNKKNLAVVPFLIGGILAVCLRYACHVLSGVFAFADWADLEKYSTAAVYSMAYNSFAFVDMAVALGAGVLLFASKAFMSQLNKSGVNANNQEVGGEVLNDDDDEIDMLIQNKEEHEKQE